MAKTLGVIIGRFQTHRLTEGHKHVIKQVATRSSRVLILVGCAPVQGTKRNPLDYKERAVMLEEFWTAECSTGGGREPGEAAPDLTIIPALDCPSDFEWVRRVDDMIGAVAPGHGAVVYGSHDSCLAAYRAAGGRWPTEDIDPLGPHSSKLRAAIVPRYSEDFRAGAIYAAERRYVNPFMCVDAAVFRDDEVLLVRKFGDEGLWRFPGGFLDSTDVSFEEAALREVLEETEVRAANPRYVTSMKVSDWRYRGGPESIFTALVVATHAFADPVPGDDAVAAEYRPYASLMQIIHPVHAQLAEALVKRVGTKSPDAKKGKK